MTTRSPLNIFMFHKHPCCQSQIKKPISQTSTLKKICKYAQRIRCVSISHKLYPSLFNHFQPINPSNSPSLPDLLRPDVPPDRKRRRWQEQGFFSGDVRPPFFHIGLQVGFGLAKFPFGPQKNMWQKKQTEF